MCLQRGWQQCAFPLHTLPFPLRIVTVDPGLVPKVNLQEEPLTITLYIAEAGHALPHIVAYAHPLAALAANGHTSSSNSGD